MDLARLFLTSIAISTLIGASTVGAGESGHQPPPPSTAQPDAPPATEQPETQPERLAARAPLSDADRSFVDRALKCGVAEMREAKLAQQQAGSAEVKSGAAELERDHAKANDELKRIAASYGVAVPAEPTPERRARYSRLKKLAGPEFDQAYLRAGRDAYQRTIALFERTEADTRNPEIRNFTRATLPTLKKHLEMMDSMHSH
jgi:putative membrane protein